MKTIAVDHFPLSSNPLYSNDYVSYYIYNSIMDPLFKYNNKLNSCCKFVNKRNKKYKIFIRDDLKYYNGEIVTIEDFYNTIISIKNKNCYAKFLLDNVKKIILFNNYISITLKHKDKFFLNKLSYFSFSPYKDGLTCGPYYIYSQDEKKIIIKRNPFYRKKIKNNNLDWIEFIKTTDITLFEKKQINMTNNTTFTISKIDYYNPIITDSNLFLIIKFNYKYFNKKNKKIRNIINNAINREKINQLLANTHVLKYDFDLLNNSKRKRLKKIKNSRIIKLKMGYTDYYPNYLIANEIKEQLKIYNIELELLKYDLCCSNDYDLYLDIEFAPININEYFYISKYFKLVHGNIYNRLCKIFEKSKCELVFKLMKNIVRKQSKIIPLLNFKYIYLCDKDLLNFNHLLMNYDEL